jgi:amino acid adenylation domain-containing protein
MTKSPPLPPPIQRRQLQTAGLSFSQESLWFLQQLDPENTAYNSTYLIKYTGGIALHSMERALNELIRRHTPLRTVYPNQRGKPIQVIQPFEPFSLPRLDFSGLPENERQQAIQSYVAVQGGKPYNLQQGPVVRFALLHENQDVDYLFSSIHHIGFDAWSQENLFSELMHFYDAFHTGKEPDLVELPIQYIDYALWQREWLSGETLETYIEHWKNILTGDLPILELPTDRPRPALQSYRGAKHSFRFSPALSSRIKDFSQRARMTSFQILLAAYALLLMRHTGQEDIIIGCPFANRSGAELDGLVGLFVNTLPIRLNTQGNPSVQEFLDQVRAVMLDAFTWQAAPFEALVSEISPQRDLSRMPVFQVTINMRNVPKRPIFAEGLGMEFVQREKISSQFDISLDFGVGEDGELEASLVYNVDLYDENTIIHMAAHFQNLLGELLIKTDRPIAELEMLTPTEWKRIVMDWNDTGVEFPQVCIHDLFTGQVDKNPQALAVVFNDNSMTYGDLEKKANQLANYLRQGGMEAEARIGIYLPRSEKNVVSLLAILKAGGAYVPLDITYPTERITYMVLDSDPAAIITLSDYANQLPDQVRKICLDTESDLINACDSSKPVPITNIDSLAYIMYTSGSTGRPKGGMNVHKGIVNYVTHLAKEYHFDASDRVVEFTSLSFDGSVWGILGTLSYGGAIVLLDDVQMRDPDYIYSAIIDHQATHINLVPTMLRAICESALAGERKTTSLRLVAPGGEVLRESDVELARRAFGESVELVNEYGPSECSIAPTHYLIPTTFKSDLQIVPIGKPISNTRTYVLDRYFHPVPVGVKGELFIGGIAVGSGYWNQPDLTAERFLPDPFWSGGRMYRTGDIVRQLPDGTICFLGRSDNQVKIRGYRVELSEIETVISEFPGVKDAVVALWRQEDSDALAAYITLSEGDREQIEGKLKTYLADHLPFYMLPATITVLEEMPLNPNRKIDRAALPRPSSKMRHGHSVAPRNKLEARMVSIWREVLGVKEVGITDNFFELGGHSLMAIRLFMRIEEEFKQSLPLLLLFKEGTVEALTTALTQKEKLTQPEGCIPIQEKGTRPPFFCVSPTVIDVVTYRDLSRALGPDQPFYALYTPKQPPVPGMEPVDTIAFFVEEIRRIQPAGPYYLGGYSGGGRYALQIAHRLQIQGERVGLVVMLDTFAPNHPVLLPWVTPGLFNFLVVLRRIQSYLWKFWILDRRGKRDLLLSGERPFRLRFKEWFNQRRQELRRPVRRKPSVSQNKDEEAQYRDYSGKVVLLRAGESLLGAKRDPTQGWGSLLRGPLEVQVVPGDHEAILFGPRIPGVARILNDYLEQACKFHSASGEDS